MKVAKDDLPLEGVRIGGVLFKPGKIVEVTKKFGDILVKRKGFIEIKGVNKNVKINGC